MCIDLQRKPRSTVSFISHKNVSYVNVCGEVVACECECRCLQGSVEDTGSCVAGVTGYCESPNVDAGYLAWSSKRAANALTC